MNKIKVIRFVIQTTGIGGAEKRFIALWLNLVEKKEMIFFIHLTNELFAECLNIDELKGIANNRGHVCFLSKESREYDFTTSLKTSADSSVLHFVMQRPMKNLQQNTIFSLTESHLTNINLKGKVRIFLSCLLSDKIDILDPSIYYFVRKVFFYKRSSLSLTLNSFVDSGKYQYCMTKKNWVVFLGIFSPIKQINRFVDSIPAINKACKANNLKFFVLGYGANEEELFSKLESYRRQGIDIEYGFKSNPHDILKYAKVIYSLQRNTNYPSKSLLEGISSGCLPITTDVGDSRKIADPSFSYYVKEGFGNKEIAEETHKIVNLDKDEFLKKSKVGSDFIKQNFKIENMANYYLELYRNFK